MMNQSICKQEKFKFSTCCDTSDRWEYRPRRHIIFFSFEINPCKLFLFLILLIVFDHSSKAQSTPGYIPTILSLDGSWQFKTDPNQNGETQGWYQTGFNSCSWDSLKVPGNWDLENQYAEYAGKAWYRKSFNVPDEWRERLLRLNFDFVSHDSKVWLNGKFIGEDHYGFLPFHYDISSYVNFGSSNELVVEIDNTFKRGALWNWGGINRKVKIEATDLERINYQHVTAIPNLQKGSAKVDMKVILENHSERTTLIDLKYTILYDGKAIKEKWSKNISLGAGDKEEHAHFDISSKDVHLWDFDHPNLYHSIVSLYRDGRMIHSLDDQFGVRKIEVDGYALKLNGKSIRPVGFNLVPDDRTSGNTLPLWRIKEDVDIMKSLGANMARISHIPLPKEFLDYLDQKGILVFSEFPLWGKDRWVDPDNPIPFKGLEKIVLSQFNHPSVIGWSVGNEIGYADKNPKVMAYVKSAIDFVGTLDSTRLIVYVSHSAMKQKEDPSKYEKFILLNSYGNWGKNADMANKNFPDKPIFYSEYAKEIIDEDPNKGVIDARGILNEMRGREYLIGGSLWTFNDYRSGFTGTAVSGNRSWGVVNVFRQPKRAFFSFKKEYSPIKELKVDWHRSNNNPTMNITIVPRGVLDIPAYALNGYRIIWTVLDKSEKITQGGFYDLPEIKPGDSSLNKQVSMLNNINGNATIKISLLTPGLYDVYDTTIYLAPPSAPIMKSVYSSSDIIRVEYDKVPFAEEYKVIYDDGAGKDTSEASIDNFIEISHLSTDKEYHFRLIAVNNFGSSQPSTGVDARLNNNELPPVIWKTEPSENGFFIGYSVQPKDYLYDVEYGTVTGKYTRKLSVKNKGVLQVSDLRNGQEYFYRLRSRKQWGFESEWTPEAKVIPDGELKPQPPKIHGVVKEGNDAIIYFEPVEKAIHYEIIHQSKGKNITVIVNGSQIRYAMIRNIIPADIISMRAANQYGHSDEIKVL